MMAVPQFLLGRRAALAALCVGLVILTLLVVLPIMAVYASQQQENSDSLYQLALFRAEASTRPQLELELQSLRQRGSATPGLITADSVSLAQAQLERDVKAIVEANGGEIHSAQLVPQVGSAIWTSFLFNAIFPYRSHGLVRLFTPSRATRLTSSSIVLTSPHRRDGKWAATHPPRQNSEIHWTIRGYRWGAK